MDFAYSPHREPGGIMHLSSPTHHGYRMEGTHFSSLQQLRRSLSRSPSKPSRFQLRTGKSDSSGSAISPLALSRAFNPKPQKPTSPNAARAESPFNPQAPPSTKKKFTLRRSGPFRSSPRNRTATPKSPRRALVDSTDLGNSTPFASRPVFGDENTPARRSSAEFWDKSESRRFGIDDKPIKFGFARSHPSNMSAPGANRFTTSQPSPLKRRDGTMGFESASGDTPNPKRRSLHAMGPVDFSIFETPQRQTAEEPQRLHQAESEDMLPAVSHSQTPLIKRAPSLKRPGLRHNATGSPRPKSTMDGEFVLPGPAASKTRHRISLDGSSLCGSSSSESPFARTPAPQHSLRGHASGHQRHPLANSLTASSSSSSLAASSPARALSPTRPTAAPRDHVFAKSLPIGAPRPQPPPSTEHFGQSSCATPFAWKMARADPAPFALSTGGLITKKNRNIDSPQSDKYQPPETPSKRFSFPPVSTQSPTTNKRASLFGAYQQQPEFGTPTVPFSLHSSKISLDTSGKGVSIFGSFGSNTERRASFVSIDGDDEVNNSPTANRMTDSQSSADDMPPTPTKHSDGAGRRSKENSLRRRQFRARVSAGADAFNAPEMTGIDIPLASSLQSITASGASPHTPNETFTPPDASRLSISGQRRGSLSFQSSFGSNSFPPLTPTTPREGTSFFAIGKAAAPIGLPKNDVDLSLSSRFQNVDKLRGAKGEFSQIFKVSGPIQHTPHASPPGSRFWVVKKSKKPILGVKDRERKLQEVRILQALRGSEHVVTYENHWEHDRHLYIETECCEQGTLERFHVEVEGRLDDFRMWKILLELTTGLEFIHRNGYVHLDLKPANILVDFEGVLKIADFGLASEYPAPPNHDGEGDRHYLAPEALEGSFDTPADIFALGVIMLEIGTGREAPEFGESWQGLRSGEFQVPSLTWSAESSDLLRDSDGNPITDRPKDDDDDLFSSKESLPPVPDKIDFSKYDEELARAPSFMIDYWNIDAIHHVISNMLAREPSERPTAQIIHNTFGCQWVEYRRRAGATVCEGQFGPSEDVLASYFHDPDAMDTS